MKPAHICLRLTLLTLLGPGGARLAAGETVPVAPVPGGIGFSFAVSGDVGGKTTLRSPGVTHGKVASHHVSAGLGTELPGWTRDSSVSAALSFGRTELDLPTTGPAVALPEEFRDLTFELGYTQPLSDAWSLTVGTSVGYHAGGPGGFRSKSLGAAFFGLASYAYTPTLTLSAGAVYDSFAEGGINRFGPAVGLAWRASERWTVAIGFPETAITYHLSKTLSVALVGEGSGGTYYVAKAPLPPAAGRPPLERTKLEYYDSRLGLGVEWTPLPALTLSLRGGIVLDREYEYRTRGYTVKSDGTAPYGALAATLHF